MTNILCPCGSKLFYGDCCEPIISDKKEATTCLELMKTRYVAFTLANTEYLVRSHHSKTRSQHDYQLSEVWSKSVRWMGLVILNKQAGEIADETGYVEFRAIYMENAQIQQIHEKSLFERENNKWVYVSGVHF